MLTVHTHDPQAEAGASIRQNDRRVCGDVPGCPPGESPPVHRWSRQSLPQGGVSWGWVRADLCEEVRSALQYRPEQWLRREGRVIKPRPEGPVFAVTLAIAQEERSCYIKERRYRSWYLRLAERAGVTGLKRASRLASPLIQNQIATPAPWGFITIRREGESLEYLLTEGVTQATSLDQYLAGEYQNFPEEERSLFRHLLAERLADLVSRLHRAGFENRDLKATNLLIQPLGTGIGEFQLHLIDLEGVRRWGVMPAFRRIYNLTRMHLSLSSRGEFSGTDALRFLRKYLGYRSQSDWKYYWRAIGLQSARRREEANRSGKVIH